VSERETPLTDAFYWCHRPQRESLDFARDLELKLAAETRSWNQLTNELADMRAERLELLAKLGEARTALEEVAKQKESPIPIVWALLSAVCREALARIDAGNEKPLA